MVGGAGKAEYSRHMQEHRLVAFYARVALDKARATTFDLHSTACFLLDVLDIGATLTDNLSPKIEAGNRFEIDRDLFFWPFALENHT